MSDDLKRVWDLTAERPAGNLLTGHTAKVFAVATTVVEGRPVAVTSSYDKTVRVWDRATGQPVGEPLTGNAYPVLAVATGVVDGRPVAVAGGEDGAVRVWDLITRQQVGAELMFPDAVRALAVTQDGRLLAAFGSQVAVLAAAHCQEPQDS